MKKIIFLILVLTTVSSAGQSYKNLTFLVPSLPQWYQKHYWRGILVDLSMGFFLFSYQGADRRLEKNRKKFRNYKSLFEHDANQIIENREVKYETFNPDSSELERILSPNEYNSRESYSSSFDMEYQMFSNRMRKNINKAWLASIGVFSIVDGYGGFYSNSSEREKNINSINALLKSVILPGWGQIYAESYTQAAWIYSLFIGFGAQAYYIDKEVDFLRTSYLDKFSQNYARRRVTERNTYLFYMLGTYLYNIFDAYLEAEMYNFNLELSFKPLNNSLSLSVKNLF